MSVYTTPLKKREMIGSHTLSVSLQRPAGFTFLPGQFVTLRLPDDPSIVPGRGRYEFSLANTPQEEDLLLVMRMRPSLFKKHLSTIPIGSPVEIEGPLGTMVIPTSEQRHLVLLAGGIGIAPFRSIILSAVSDRSACPITLFYSNPTPDDAVFFDEFTHLSTEHAHVQFIPVMTRMVPKDTAWGGEIGYFTSALLSKYLQDLQHAVYYIVGPVRMVIATKRALRSIGALEEAIHMEIFTGY